MRICFVLLFCLSTIAYSQNTFKGIVIDNKDHIPVPYASVYISGTTKGTYTDLKGNFTLNDVYAPCQLVFSHLSYNTQMTVIDQSTSNELTIYLKEKSKQLGEVTVSDRNMRDKNIEEFKKAFLGDDHWGKHAMLKNDSALIFSRKVDTLKRKADTLAYITPFKSIPKNDRIEWSKDSSFIYILSPVFSVRTKAPLLVDLPLLGYTLYIDLVSFTLRENIGWLDCNFWGYYHFIPYSTSGKRQNAKYEKNRQAAYYNSAKHFCQSFYHNRLKENGFMVAANIVNDSTKSKTRRFININSIAKYNNAKELQLIGLRDKGLYIYYFCKYNGKPTDLTGSEDDEQSSEGNVWKKYLTKLDPVNNSNVTFKSDTCTIRSNGTIPDNNIMFSGKISSKRVGASLPFDYLPKE